MFFRESTVWVNAYVHIKSSWCIKNAAINKRLKKIIGSYGLCLEYLLSTAFYLQKVGVRFDSQLSGKGLLSHWFGTNTFLRWSVLDSSAACCILGWTTWEPHNLLRIVRWLLNNSDSAVRKAWTELMCLPCFMSTSGQVLCYRNHIFCICKPVMLIMLLISLD